jgi:ferrous iron transport protein B
MMTEVESMDTIRGILVDQHGWTLLTAINLMLFSLLHNPCATTIITIYKETLSVKWTTIGTLLPLGLAFLVTFLVAQIWRLF